MRAIDFILIGAGALVASLILLLFTNSNPYQFFITLFGGWVMGALLLYLLNNFGVLKLDA